MQNVSLLQWVAAKSSTACLAVVFAMHGYPSVAETRPVVGPLRSMTEGSAVELPEGGGDDYRARMTLWSVPARASTPPLVQKVEPAESKGAAKLVVSSPFGWRSDPIKGGRRRHSGIDLPGRSGTAVFATGNGTVTFAGWMTGYGNVVQIDHDSGLRTRFGHLSRILVSRGDTLRLGEIIGRMGSTGRSTGTHLHYEVRADGMPVNPMSYMGRSAPGEFQTVWLPETPVNARWTGWQHERKASSLPASKIR